MSGGRSLRLLAAALGLVSALVPTLVLAAGSWVVVPSPNVPAQKDNSLQATAAISASDIWAVGYYNAGPADQTLIQHWNGAAWSVVPSANSMSTQNNELYGVAAISSSDVWAVGTYETGAEVQQTLIEHWDGSAWSAVASPNAGAGDNYLRSVAAISSTDVWAVGYGGTPRHTLTEHWNGAAWSIVASQDVGTSDQLNGVAAVSSTDVWAVGYAVNGGEQTLTEHWNGAAWSVVASANAAANNRLQAVTAVSTSDVWAVGMDNAGGGSPNQTLAERWNGAAWAVVASPNSGALSNTLNAVAEVTTSDVWAVGSVSTGALTTQTLTEHWNGVAWLIVASANSSPAQANTLNAVAAVSASNVWTVGSYNNGTNQTLVEQYNGTSWSIISSPSALGANGDQLNGVVTISAIDVWAVGKSDNTAAVSQTLTEHYNGVGWSIVASPNAAGSQSNYLSGTAAVSSGNVYAVGHYMSAAGHNQTLIEQWNGAAWSVVASPNTSALQDNSLQSVTAISASDVWAVGTANSQTLIEHWDGAAWSIVASPNAGGSTNDTLNSATAITGSDVWAVGSYVAGAQQTLTEHWNGLAWSIVAAPNVGGASGDSLTSVTAISTSDVWAVGFSMSGFFSDQTLAEHWNGLAWSIVATPNVGGAVSDSLNGVSAVSTSDVWAVGSYSAGFGQQQTLAEHWDGASWTIGTSANVTADSQNQLQAIAMVSSASGWAVGNYNGSNTLVEDFVGVCSGGALALPDPGPQSFAPLGLTGVDQTETTTVTLQPSDMTGGGLGWAVQATASQFTSGGNTLPATALSVTAAGAATAGPGNCSLPVNSVAYPLTLSSAAVKIYDSAVGTGAGPSNVPFTFTLAVPATTHVGVYTSTWVFTVVSGP